MFATLATLRAAMLDLQARTGDQSLAQSVERGLHRLERVTYDAGGKSTVTPLTERVTLEQHLANLRAFGEG